MEFQVFYSIMYNAYYRGISINQQNNAYIKSKNLKYIHMSPDLKNLPYGLNKHVYNTSPHDYTI